MKRAEEDGRAFAMRLVADGPVRAMPMVATARTSLLPRIYFRIFRILRKVTIAATRFATAIPINAAPSIFSGVISACLPTPE